MVKRERKGWRGLLYPLTQKRAVTALRPGMSGKISETLRSPETPGKTRILRPSKVSTQENIRECVGAKVSLIGFILTTRAPVRLLEDTFPVPLYSTTFLGLKFKI
jgi:nitrogenase molybdenum-iron protein alpha/beta subunit